MSHPNTSTALADVIVDELVRNGVRHFVVAPGSRSAPLAIALAGRSDVDLIVGLDERSAGFHALGIGKAIGRPAAVVVTSGTAVANLYPAVVEAETSGTPLVLITADRPPEMVGVGSNQTIDQERAFSSHARFHRVGPAEDRAGEARAWRSTVCRVVTESLGWDGPPGPVQLNVAFREPLVPVTDDGRTVGEVYVSDTSGRSDTSPWTVTASGEMDMFELTDEWTGYERGLVVVGPGHPMAVAHADRLAARLGWPLICDVASGGRPPQTISTAHHLATHLGDRLRPEVVIQFGRPGSSRAIEALVSGSRRLVVAPSGWNDPAREASAIVRGWPVVVTQPVSSGEWRRGWLELDRIARSAMDRAIDELGVAAEPRLARDVADAVAPGGILVAGSSMPIRDLDMFMRPRPIGVIANRGASGIDGFVSTSLGVSAAGAGPVVALGGDLSMLHDANGFLIDPRPSAVFVVANNDGGGIFSFLPQARHAADRFERIFGTPHGRSFERLAAFHGVSHRWVDVPVGSLVAEAVAAGGVHILEAVGDRAANVVHHRRIVEAVGTALAD